MRSVTMHRMAVEGIIDTYVNEEVTLPILTVTSTFDTKENTLGTLLATNVKGSQYGFCC